MAVVNTARRLSNRVIDADIESVDGLRTVEGYIPVRDEASTDNSKKSAKPCSPSSSAKPSWP
jgi:hypothetical protein